MQTAAKIAQPPRDLALFEMQAVNREGDAGRTRRFASYAAYVTALPVTLVECALMATVALLHDFFWRVVYARAWYPETARKKPKRMIKQQLDAEVALGAMQTLEKIRQETRAQMFWLSGTLLGLQRLGRPLPHDNDLDAGINISDPHYRDFMRALWSSPYVTSIEPQFLSLKCQVQNPDLHVVPGGIIRFKASIISENHPQSPPVKTDIFLHFDYCGGSMHGSRNSLWWNSPFGIVRRNFGAWQFSVPEDTHLHLTENYGPYEAEVKDFENSIDCPNAMNIFSWQSVVYLLSRQQMMRRLGRKDRVREINRRIKATILKGILPTRNPFQA